MKHWSRFKVVLVLLTVLLVVTFLLWGILPAYVNSPVRTPFLRTMNAIKALQAAVILYCEEYKELPVSQEQLEKYAPGATDSDGWGNRIKYVHNNPIVNDKLFDVYSVGKNGVDEYSEKMHGGDIVVVLVRDGDDILVVLGESYIERLREALAADQTDSGASVNP